MSLDRGRIVLPARGRFDLPALIAAGGGIVPPPWRWQDGARPLLERAERLPDGSVRLLRIRPEPGGVVLHVTGRAARDVETLAPLAVRVRRALWLDEAPGRPRMRDQRPLGLARAERVLRGTTVFEDVVGTLVTCDRPAAAHRALAGLVSFGSPCPADRRLRAFPAPDVLARLPLRELRRRTGLHPGASWIRALARDVARGACDPRDLDDLPARDVRRALRAVEGLGPAGVRAVLRRLGFAAARPALRPAPKRVPRTRRGARS